MRVKRKKKKFWKITRHNIVIRQYAELWTIPCSCDKLTKIMSTTVLLQSFCLTSKLILNNVI